MSKPRVGLEMDVGQVYTHEQVTTISKSVHNVYYENKVCLVGLYSFLSADSHLTLLKCSGTFRMVFMV